MRKPLARILLVGAKAAREILPFASTLRVVPTADRRYPGPRKTQNRGQIKPLPWRVGRSDRRRFL